MGVEEILLWWWFAQWVVRKEATLCSWRGCWCAARAGQVQLVLLLVLLLVGGWKLAAAVGGGYDVGVA